ncbi:unnamed protein product, partial [Effrenium voratum]
LAVQLQTREVLSPVTFAGLACADHDQWTLAVSLLSQMQAMRVPPVAANFNAAATVVDWPMAMCLLDEALRRRRAPHGSRVALRQQRFERAFGRHGVGEGAAAAVVSPGAAAGGHLHLQCGHFGCCLRRRLGMGLGAASPGPKRAAAAGRGGSECGHHGLHLRVAGGPSAAAGSYPATIGQHRQLQYGDECLLLVRQALRGPRLLGQSARVRSQSAGGRCWVQPGAACMRCRRLVAVGHKASPCRARGAHGARRHMPGRCAGGLPAQVAICQAFAAGGPSPTAAVGGPCLWLRPERLPPKPPVPRCEVPPEGLAGQRLERHAPPGEKKKECGGVLFLAQVQGWKGALAGCIIYMLYFGRHENMEHLAMMERLTESRLPLWMVQKALAPEDEEEEAALDLEALQQRLGSPPATLRLPEAAATRAEAVRPLSQQVLLRHGSFLQLLQGLLALDPTGRVAAAKALSAPFLVQQVEE